VKLTAEHIYLFFILVCKQTRGYRATSRSCYNKTHEETTIKGFNKLGPNCSTLKKQEHPALLLLNQRLAKVPLSAEKKDDAIFSTIFEAFWEHCGRMERTAKGRCLGLKNSILSLKKQSERATLVKGRMKNEICKCQTPLGN
jgi:hypothetical protein